MRITPSRPLIGTLLLSVGSGILVLASGLASGLAPALAPAILFAQTRPSAPDAASATASTPAPAAASPRNPDDPADDVVRRVHAAALTIDAHLDLRDDFNTPGNDAGTETVDQFDLPKLERGALDVATVALFADPARRTPGNVAAARAQVDRKLAALRRLVSQHPDRLEIATSAADIERIAAAGKHAILLSFLNTLSIGADLNGIDTYHKEGVRLFAFTHAANTDFADSSRPNASYGDTPDEAGGLTALGKQAVGRLNRLGVVVDVSQITPAAVRQVLEISKAPVVASHSAVRARVNATRNLTNAELRGIADKGGVVHIVAFAPYVSASREVAEAAAKRQRTLRETFALGPADDPAVKLDAVTYRKYQDTYRGFSRTGWQAATLVEYLDAVDYAVRLIGIDHVGLSSDFNHGGGVTGWKDVGESPNVTRELLKRGYSEADIRKLWGGNFLRVLKAAETTAAQLRTERTVTSR